MILFLDVYKRQAQDNQLVLFYVSDGLEVEDELRGYLMSKLPAYMVPKKYVRYLHLDTEQLPVLCAASREIPGLLRKMLWNWEEGMSAILTLSLIHI